MLCAHGVHVQAIEASCTVKAPGHTTFMPKRFLILDPSPRCERLPLEQQPLNKQGWGPRASAGAPGKPGGVSFPNGSVDVRWLRWVSLRAISGCQRHSSCRPVGLGPLPGERRGHMRYLNTVLAALFPSFHASSS